MRDFRDAKAMAQSIRAALAAKDVKFTVAESLELVAKAFGAADWNTLAAAIKAAEAEKAAGPVPQPPFDDNAHLDRMAVGLGWPDWEAMVQALRTLRPRGPPPRERAERRPAEPPPVAPARTGQRFSPALEASLHRATALAAERKHVYTTLEHLLLALTEDPDATAVMGACEVDIATLRTSVAQHVDADLKQIVGSVGHEPEPTAAFHRVVVQSVVYAQSTGRHPVTGADTLVAMFSEQESHAFHFLRAQKMDRYDAVNFIANGIRKDGAAA